MKKFWTILDKVWRILVCVILAIALIAASLLFAISLQPVQEKAVAKAEQILKEKTGIDMTVGSVRISPLLNIALEDVTALDQSQDTLLRCGRLILDSDILSLRDSVVNVNEFLLENVSLSSRGLLGDIALEGSVDKIFIRSDSTSLQGRYTLLNALELKGADITLGLAPLESSSSTFDWRFTAPDVTLEDINFNLSSAGLGIRLAEGRATASGDIGKMIYNVGRLELTGAEAALGGRTYTLDSLRAFGSMDGTALLLPSIKAYSGAVGVTGKASCDLADPIVTSVYDIALKLNGFRLKDFIDTKMNCTASGTFKAKGHGIDPMSGRTLINVKADIQDACYSDIQIGKTKLDAKVTGGGASGFISSRARMSTGSLDVSAGANIGFNVSSLANKRPLLRARMALNDISFAKDSLALSADSLRLGVYADYEKTALVLRTEGIEAKARAEEYLLDLADELQDLAAALPRNLDDVDLVALKQLLPPLQLALNVDPDNPLQNLIEGTGIAFDAAALQASLSRESGIIASLQTEGVRKDSLELNSLNLDLRQRDDVLDCRADAEVKAQAGLPETKVTLNGWLNNNDGKVNIKAASKIVDGIMSFKDIAADATADINATMDARKLSAQGAILLGNLKYGEHFFEDRFALLSMKPEPNGDYDINVTTDEIPMPIFKSYISSEDITLDGILSAKVNLHGPLNDLALTVEATPVDGVIHYSPYSVDLFLAEDTVRIEDMVCKIPAMHIYGVDSTLAVLSGNIDLHNKWNIDLSIDSERFRPAPLSQSDTTRSYYGNAVAALALKVSGDNDLQFVNGDIDILPETDIIYALGKKNHVHAKASGKLFLDYPVQGDMGLHGRINIDSGELKYTLPFYPLAPFKIDKGSHIDLDGPISALKMNVTAMQKSKAIVSETGERSRSVDFNVGLKITDGMDNIGLHFLMEAPNDPAIQEEIENMTVEDKDRIAATLLTTGMYTSDTNVDAFQSGYALTSILQHSLNSLASNSLGKIVDVDLGMGSNSELDAVTTKYTMNVSKSFFDDRLKLSVGGSVAASVNEEGTSGTAFLDNVSAEYMFGEKRRTSVTLFHKRDYENIMDGELNKEGIGVKTGFSWGEEDPYLLDLRGDLSYRSNMQIGPSLSATLSKSNLFGKGETLSAKLHGAYYAKVKDRTASGNDNINMGVDLAMSVPNYKKAGASSRYRIGYMHENLARARYLDKFSLGMTHLFRTGKFTTHEFSPIDVSVVSSRATEKYYEDITSIHQLINSLIHDEYIPAVKYRFNYDNTPDKDKAVNTRFSFGATESGNLISGVQALFGKNWNEKDKRFIFDDYNQFVRFDAELRNSFRVGERSRIATRLFAGAAIPFGNSEEIPLSQVFYSGGQSSVRGFAPRSIGPGGYYSPIYNLYFYHSGSLKGEANIEYRFPLFWMLEGAVFVDAGNVWLTENTSDTLDEETRIMMDILNIPYDYVDALRWDSLLSTTALSTGFGIRLVYQSIVVRFDLGLPIHYPFNTGVPAYYNVPSFGDAFHLNFGIGYPF